MQEIHWRPDLDGCLELVPAGIRYAVASIDPDPNDPIFGWLSPFSPYSFPAYGMTFQHCCWSGWPYPYRKHFALTHSLPADAARDPEWFVSSGSNASWQCYFEEVVRLLEIRANCWPGWLARFHALTLPIAKSGNENQALLHMKSHFCERGSACL